VDISKGSVTTTGFTVADKHFSESEWNLSTKGLRQDDKVLMSLRHFHSYLCGQCVVDHNADVVPVCQMHTVTK